MTQRISNRTALEPVEHTGYTSGTIDSVDFENDTADILCGGELYTAVPVFYNCPEAGAVQPNGALRNSAAAFARGDEVLVRTHDSLPSHIAGFTGDLWPAVKTPAFVFDSAYTYDHRTSSLREIPSQLFFERYGRLDTTPCEVQFETYVNQQPDDLSSGFKSVQQHNDYGGSHNRLSRFYCMGRLICTTYNSEDGNGIFNGTRANILGAFRNQETGWGCVIYQINTFTDWRPGISGNVRFDYHIYTSAGLRQKIASAQTDITGYESECTGETVSAPGFSAASNTAYGKMMPGSLVINKAGLFSSDGDSNLAGSDGLKKTMCMNISEKTGGAAHDIFYINPAPHLEIPDSTLTDGYELYIKKR